MDMCDCNQQPALMLSYSGPFHFERQSAGAAGYDITAAHFLQIPPGGSGRLVSTGLHVALPPNTVGIIKSRSSLAAKFDVEVGAGVIDEDYRGEVKVLLRNFGSEPFQVVAGMRIAQMVIIPIFKERGQQIPTRDLLSETERGEAGFGSTGGLACEE
jgi:deoxyuridine 5'-triphosphate nucleotidohydrolase